MEPLTKTTTFIGCASGDCECFCFDRRTPEKTYRDGTLDVSKQIDRDNASRIYPDDLLPDGHGARVGRWTITITFEATDE